MYLTTVHRPESQPKLFTDEVTGEVIKLLLVCEGGSPVERSRGSTACR
jgi:hypothetical protein